MSRRIITVLVLLAGAMPLAAQEVIDSFDGDSNGDRLGWSVGGAGDVNGDGTPDVIAGAPRDDNAGSSSGSARVYSGATGAILFTANGDGAADQFGYSVSGAGDVDGNGTDDVIAGAHLDDDNGSASGMARVLLAGVVVKYTFLGDAAGDEFGKAVAAAGDVDGDGWDDVIVGAPQSIGGGNGYARIFSGRTGFAIRTLNGIDLGSSFGNAVAGVGDLDGDGKDEVIVGAWLDDTPGISRGRAYVYRGSDGSVMHTLSGTADFDWFGWSVAGAGDVDGDGTPDVIVGAYGADAGGSDAGQAKVFSGLTGGLLLTLDGQADFENHGWSVGSPGDVDGDGKSDLAVGSPFSGNGLVRVYSGATGCSMITLSGDAAGDNFGRSLSGAGTVDADTIGDLVVGAPLDDNTGSSSGSATIFSGFFVWKDLCNALAGTNGEPSLSATGTLVAGDPVSLTLDSALENTSAALVVGLSSAMASFKGGVMVPKTDFLFLGLPTGPLGQLVLGSTWPTGLPSGLATYFQYWVTDAGGPVGFSASNGISGTTP